MIPAAPQERRKHIRYPLGVTASVALPGGSSRSCLIRDVCAGGLFLSMEGFGGESPLADGQLSRDDEVVVRVDAERDSPREPLAIAAPVARVLPNGMGLKFANLDGPSTDAVRRLVTLVRQSGAARQEPAPATPDPASITPPRPVVGDVMHTTRRLLELDRGVHGRDGLPAVATTKTSADPAAREAVIRALSKLQRSSAFVAPNEDGSLALRDRLSAVWRESGPEISEADGIIIEIVSRLLDAILEDPLVNVQVKGWLRRLAIPLLKVALQDGFFFFANEHHPAREALNRLGSLNLSTANAARDVAALNDLVDRIVTGADRGGRTEGFELRQSVFSEAQAELDAILEEQHASYTENVTRVVRERVVQQSLLEARRGAPAAVPPGAAARSKSQTPPAELMRWLVRIDQLKEGDAVYTRARDGHTARLKLAHVSQDRESLLFVDAAGEKAATFTRQALAMQFRHGDVWVLDASSLPVVDRGIYRMLSELHRGIASKVIRDELTGLLNRKGIEAHIEEALARAITMGSGSVVCMVELDRLRDIVGKCGPQAAGEVLKRFAPVLEAQVRGKGAAARIQGGRFAALLHDCNTETALSAADSFRKTMAGARCTWRGEAFPLTVSAGLAGVDALCGDVVGVLAAADAALESARRAGGNRVQTESRAPHAPAAHAPPDTRVDRVLAGTGLKLRCQRVAPIGADGALAAHYEILLGVEEGASGVTVPGDFIRAAERSNRMPAVDRWVVRAALEWMSRNRATVDSVDGYSINVSGASLSDPGFADYVLECVTETGVPAAKIVFEITESATIDTLPMAVNFMHALKEHGARFSLDRFGAGESSLAHLETLPIDYVKIDGSLVREIPASTRNFAVVQSLNEVSHFLGKKTIAQCVENDAVLARLRQIGVDYAQGFRLERPAALA